MNATANMTDFATPCGEETIGVRERDFQDYSIDVYRRMGFSDERALPEIYDLYAEVLGKPEKTGDYISEEVADLVRWQVSPDVTQSSNGLEQEKKLLRVLDGLARIMKKYPPAQDLEAVLRSHVAARA